ncbi:MAG: hypothetical protein GKR91_16485 [Pseudomonadales bacterium]|nr:hypothetical protein [Pseudomonadales bacterium]
MKELNIETLVEAANQHEAESGALLKILAAHLGSLPKVITLPEDEPGKALREFVIEYINHVPTFIAAVSFHATDAGIGDYVQPFLEVARNYFLEPVNANIAEEGLEALMQQAYLSHRLIEEVNDQYIVRAGIPLIPMDITKANIIVHHLIGETLANSLDDVVEETAKQMTAQDSVYGSNEFKEYVETRKGKGWDQVWKQWSDMTNTLAIDLDFENRQKKDSH